MNIMDKFIRHPGPGVHASYTTVEEFAKDDAGFVVELDILTDKAGNHTYEVLLFTPDGCEAEPWFTLAAFEGSPEGECAARVVAEACAKAIRYREAANATQE